MPFIQYEDWKPQDDAQRIVDIANEILQSYRDQGYDLSLRQLYYQFVARDMLPNVPASYEKLGAIMTRARDAGMVDWNSLVDRGRSLYGHTHYEDGESFLQEVADNFHLDLWEGQETRVHVWVEKDALSGVIARAVDGLDVDYFPCKGYMSASAIWRMGRMMLRNHDRWVILHLGDHDPSGIDMTRDIQERLDKYSLPTRREYEGGKKSPDIQVIRIALTMEQIERYNPPPNPAKVSDSRAPAYISEFGNDSWELDALEPQMIVDLVRSEIEQRINNRDLFEFREAEQERIRERIRTTEVSEDGTD